MALARSTFFALLFWSIQICRAQSPVVHDPVMIQEGKRYYVFVTGMGISVLSSHDLVNWKKEKAVFHNPPAWAVEAVPGFKGHIWAPDISHHNGLYYLYYSVSAFGKNTSCIGLAVNKTLDPESPDFKWIDHGKIVESVPGRDLWNAIDPNMIVDGDGVPWLVFGSFWSGMKLVKLQSDGLTIARPEVWYTVAKRERSFKVDDRDPGPGAVEAPFIFKKGDIYYLFLSFDFCCRGENSTYKVVVGKSKKIEGPYVDKAGVRLDEGGGTLVIEGNEEWAGVGHNSVYTVDGEDVMLFHGYDKRDGGKPKLRIEKLSWDAEGFPSVTPKK